MHKPEALLLLCLATLISLPSATDAYSLEIDEELSATIGALARLGYQIDAANGDVDQGPYIQMARLAAGVAHKSLGSGFVQVEGASGTLQLLDAFVELRPVEQLGVRAGLYRLPTTADFHVGAAGIPFSNRSMLIRMTYPRLLGAEVLSDIDMGGAKLNTRVGMFQPNAASLALLPDGDGNFFSARVGVDFESGLGLHASYLHLLFAENVPVVPVEDPMAPAVQPVAYPRVIDAAVTYRTKSWNLALEGLIAPNSDDGSDDLNLAAYAHGAYRMPLSDKIDLAPGARYDVTSQTGVLTHRITVGASLFVFGNNLKFQPNYEVYLTDDDVAHSVLLTMQGTF